MSRKEKVLVLLAVVFAGVYAVFFTGWFRPRLIRIEHSSRPLREAWSGGVRVDTNGAFADSVTFSLHQDYRLTHVKVVRVDEASTNKYPRALWELHSRKGSDPVNAISYGFPVPGMTSPPPNLPPDRLVRGVEYRLLVEAGSARGTNDFAIGGKAASRR